MGFTQWRNHVKVLAPEDNFKAFECKNVSKFTIFVSMFSDGHLVLLQKYSKLEQINEFSLPLKSLGNLGFLNYHLL